MNRKQVAVVKNLGLAAFLVCLFSVPMPAQTVAKGEFDLPCPAKWGVADLPAGHYTFVLDSTAKQGRLIIRGAKTAPFIQATEVDDHQAVDRSELVMVRTGGIGIVRAMRLAGYGITFYYKVPDSVKLLADKQPQLLQRAPIAISGR